MQGVRNYPVVLLTLLALLASATAAAERRPVLDQIDAPHNYYFREMYLPQLTSGPSAVAWAPDSRSVVFSMQGSLWRQRVDSVLAEQLTAGPGYDYQPDWSPNGRWIAFVRYNGAALELERLDTVSGAIMELTRDSAVNVEPRWSPDSGRLAWVSTAGTGHFHVFVGTVNDDGMSAAAAVWPERRSTSARYYYSPIDHELSPAWSPDGKELLYVGNPEINYGTGALWRRGLAADARPVLVREEETTWKARPDWSPDGKRVIYSSYAGRQWHQLWIATAAGGGDPLPVSFGEYDNTGARWSPDGKQIAFISNRNGATEIWLQEILGGRQRLLDIRERRYRQPVGELRLKTVDTQDRPVAARVEMLGADGRAYAPNDAWVHADDGFDRRKTQFEAHYFHTRGDTVVTLPAGTASITVWRGLEHQVTRRSVKITAGKSEDLTVPLQPLALPSDWTQQWLSGDVHVHMNYAGTYRATPERLVAQATAEDLDLVFNLIVNKEQRVPDIGYFSTAPDPASTDSVLLLHSQEFHTSYWGHLGLLGLRDHFLLPDFSAYPNTAFASPYPTNAAVADLAHQQGALVGYVHPFDELPDPAKDVALTHELPVDVALGKVDYYEVLGFSDHKISATVWYRLLNCGFRPAAAAGTDAMTNFASLRGPVGLNRVYVLTPHASAEPAVREAEWLAGLKAGHTMATNGPLLGFVVEGQPPGSEIAMPAASGEVHYRGFLRSAVPADHLEIIFNGKVVRTIRLTGDRTSADIDGRVKVTAPGWLLLRAWNDDSSPLTLDGYPYATTNPVFFQNAGATIRCGADADYLLAWIDRVYAAAAAHTGYNTTIERETTLAQIRAARTVIAGRR
jgi:hypothetical protein